MRAYHAHLYLHLDTANEYQPVTFASPLTVEEDDKLVWTVLMQCEAFSRIPIQPTDVEATTKTTAMKYFVMLNSQVIKSLPQTVVDELSVTDDNGPWIAMVCDLKDYKHKDYQRLIIEKQQSQESLTHQLSSVLEQEERRQRQLTVQQENQLAKTLLTSSIVTDCLTRSSVPFYSFSKADGGVLIFFPKKWLTLVSKVLGDTNAY
jgi:hypothetical protein